MELFKESGVTGRVYCVFDRRTNMEKAFKEAAAVRKVARDKLESIPVWTKGKTLYTKQRKGFEKRVAIISHGA